jgi:hypothetical protein
MTSIDGRITKLRRQIGVGDFLNTTVHNLLLDYNTEGH